eukprot:Clim_evm22s15 gene=Clim_evmTU22s15
MDDEVAQSGKGSTPITEPSKSSVSDVKERLAYLRRTGIRSPVEVIALWNSKLSSTALSPRAVDTWDIYEQVCQAAFEIGDSSLAQDLLGKIRQKFPQSMRAKLLVGQSKEFEGKLNEAAQVYKDILKEDKNHQIAQKRLVSLALARHEYPEAISGLNKYLETWITDVEAWQKLADLYMERGAYEEASHAYEDLILLRPFNYHNYIGLGEALYALALQQSAPGSSGASVSTQVETLLKARKYLAQACKMNGASVRCWFALHRCCGLLLSKSEYAKQDVDPSTTESLAELAQEQILNTYTSEKGSSAGITEAVGAYLTEALRDDTTAVH